MIGRVVDKQFFTNGLRYKPELSFVLPAYNEGDNIREVIERMDNAMKGSGITYEVIVVNDGSKDETGKKAIEIAQCNGHVKVISYHKNMGKGYALKTGFFNAAGDTVAFIDSDLDIDPMQIKQYIHALNYGDIAVASKKHPQSHVEKTLLRGFLSSGFNIMVRLLTGLRLGDTQSGLKAGKWKSLEKVFSVLSVKRFAFDAELLAVANLYGLRIIEMPVNIRLTNGFFNPKEILRMLIDLLGITYRLRVSKLYLNSNFDDKSKCF